MKKIKRMACLLPLFGWILGGCFAASGPPGDEPFSADDAIAKVIRQEQRIHFPKTEGKIEGIIHGAVRIRECAFPVRSRPPRKTKRHGLHRQADGNVERERFQA